MILQGLQVQTPPIVSQSQLTQRRKPIRTTVLGTATNRKGQHQQQQHCHINMIQREHHNEQHHGITEMKLKQRRGHTNEMNEVNTEQNQTQHNMNQQRQGEHDSNNHHNLAAVEHDKPQH